MCKFEEYARVEEEKLRRRLAQEAMTPSIEPEKPTSQAASSHAPPPSAKRGSKEANFWSPQGTATTGAWHPKGRGQGRPEAFPE